MKPIVDVAAAVFLRGNAGDREFLLARRPAGKAYAGYWEFPGGKVEPGETLAAALVRELQEELGVTAEDAWPWLCREFVYPHATVRLKFFKVVSWHGEITPIEHSGLVWLKPGEPVTVAPILPANGPIIRALELPDTYALTNAEENGVEHELARLDKALRNGLRLLQIRDKTLPPAERWRLADSAMRLARRWPQVRVLINDDEDLARAVGAHGLHLSSARLLQTEQRPAFDWVAASCHSASDLARAVELGLDFTVLGPLMPTPTHPDAAGMGWSEFARLTARSAVPVFALGGMRESLLGTAHGHGAQGIALMRGWS